MDYLQQLRSKVGHQKVIMIYACACVRNSQGQILWQKRGDFGFWGLPGGILEINENLHECLVREVFEETRLQIVPLKLIGIYSSPDFDVTYPNHDEVQQVTFLYDCMVISGQLAPDLNETLDLQWFPENEVPPTAPWYEVMAADIFTNPAHISFQQGSSGTQPGPHGYLSLMGAQFQTQLFQVVGVSLLIFNAQGEILLVKQAGNRLWELPGNWMELGERVDHAAIRAAEKLMGDCQALRLKILQVISDPDLRSDQPNLPPHRPVQVVLEATCDNLLHHSQAKSQNQTFALDSLPELSKLTQRILRELDRRPPA